MTNRKEKNEFGERQGWVDHCKYVTRVSCVFNLKKEYTRKSLSMDKHPFLEVWWHGVAGDL